MIGSPQAGGPPKIVENVRPRDTVFMFYAFLPTVHFWFLRRAVAKVVSSPSGIASILDLLARPDASPPPKMKHPFSMRALARVCADAVVGLTVTADGSASAVDTVEGLVFLLQSDATTSVLARM